MSDRAHVVLGSTLALLLAVPLGAATGGLTALVRRDGPSDRLSPLLEQRVRSAITVYEQKRKDLVQPRRVQPPEPFVYRFFPQAGVLGQDLFIVNFTDLDSSRRGILDWDCSGYTYEGHQGHDSVIRSFREQAIGVPVFAVRDGTVVDTHDGEPDMNTEQNDVPANFVVIDHGSGYYGLYYHFKKGSVAVTPGQAVSEGTQIGLTGSSGFSDVPHLHFESWKDGRWFEPSAGDCRPGDSFWVSQPPVLRDFYVSGAAMTAGIIRNFTNRGLLLDETPRIATFPVGLRTVGVRLDVRNLAGGSVYTIRAVKPDGTVAVELSGSWGNPTLYRDSWGIFSFQTQLDTPGVWRFQLDTNGAPAADLPFTVVSDASEVVNRPPNPIEVSLEPRAPQNGQIMTCQVHTSLLERDPDYDVVSYRYEWTVNRHLVRSVTSAALTDILAKGMTRKRDRVSCTVTPMDGMGRAAVASAESVK